MTNKTKEELIDVWCRIAKKNSWIQDAWDPPLTKKSFHECKTLDELKERFTHANWCLGQAFFYKNYCFINQIDGGSEFLTIRNDVVFESISAHLMVEKNDDPNDKWNFDNCFARWEAATDKQLINSDY